MTRGLLRLSPEVYDLFQVDVDGAALKAVDFGATARRDAEPERSPHRGQAGGDGAAGPALGRAGARAPGPRRHAARGPQGSPRTQQAIEAGTDTVFGAEDLVRGYRVDVFDEDAPSGARWFSLHRRVVEHTFKPADDGTPIGPLEVTDEGYLKATTASSETKEHPTPVRRPLPARDDLRLGGLEPRRAAPGQADRRARRGRRRDAASPDHDPELGNPFPLVSEVRVAARVAAEAADRSHLPPPSSDGRPRRQQRAVLRARARSARTRP